MDKKQKYATIIKIVVAFLVLLLAGTVASLALAGLVSLLAFVAFIGVAFVAIAAAPWFSLKVSTFFLKQFKNTVRENPVEARQVVEMRQAEKIKEAEQKIQVFNGAVKDYETKVESIRKKYPADAPKYEAHLESMKKLLKLRYGTLRQAMADLDLFRTETQRVSMIWDMTQASSALENAAGILTEEDAWDKIINDESLAAVDKAMADSFAAMDHALMLEDMSKIQTLNFAPPAKQLETVERVEVVAEVLPLKQQALR